MAFTVWLSLCSYHCVVITVWLSLCGYHCVVITVWLSLCSYHHKSTLYRKQYLFVAFWHCYTCAYTLWYQWYVSTASCPASNASCFCMMGKMLPMCKKKLAVETGNEVKTAVHPYYCNDIHIWLCVPGAVY